MNVFQSHNAPRNNTVLLPAWRRHVLMAMIMTGFAVLLGRSIYLQSTHHAFLQKEGDARYTRTLELPSHRGMIKDRNGETLAMSAAVESIWASPPDVKISPTQVNALAKLLAIKPNELSKKLNNNEREFVYIKRRIAPQLANEVMRLKIAGVFTQREYRRYYPAGEDAAHLTGFTGLEGTGKEGYELAYQDLLMGKSGSRKVIKDRQGHVVEELGAVVVPQEGHDLALAIDLRLQHLAYREIAQAVTAQKALAGAVVVLDAKTGEVLAMANVPSYNPNNPANLQGRLRNRAVIDNFEPGSTMKPFTAAAALESGKFTLSSKIDTQGGEMVVGDATIHDAHPHGNLTIAEIIQKSSNVGASKLALSLDKKFYWSMFDHLGFGRSPETGFPGEAKGKLRGYKTWQRIEQATMSYGHGISVTLLQLARAYTVFANAGELKPVSLVRIDENPVGEMVFGAQTANDVKDMLELVVLPGGTAPKAQVLGYRVGGKTGTAHKLGSHGYIEDKYVASFVGLAPASNPRLIVAVMIDEPSNGEYYGGAVAAPVFSRVMTEALRMLSVPQDAPNNNVVIPDAPEVQEVF